MKQINDFINEVNNQQNTKKVKLCDFYNNGYDINYIYVEFNGENKYSPEINFYKTCNELISKLKYDFDENRVDKRVNEKIISSIKSIQPGESKIYIFGYTSIDEYNEKYLSKEKDGIETNWFFISRIKKY